MPAEKSIFNSFRFQGKLLGTFFPVRCHLLTFFFGGGEEVKLFKTVSLQLVS